MAYGVVKWFNFAKGYGFIAPHDGGNDIFVHVSALTAAGIKGLSEGQKISYELEIKNGKTCAARLSLG